ncbi:MAG: molecular chaperone HtpG [Verrucomicrobiae bacterium]|nr:molecular chaperone HtpG [Verrucomicrobiae bacterium]
MSANETAATVEHHAFQAEVARLLHLMVHSVYSNKDIFLRELISNAADACEKLRYLALSEPDLVAGDPALGIAVETDEAAGRLSVVDNGIGMTREEMVENLGTIARSGTRAFLDGLAEAKDGGNLIGRFGVGFYAAFMVADRVRVVSRKAGADEAFAWTSDGKGAFTVEPVGLDAAPARGTRVELHLAEDARDYAKAATAERIVRAYSAHVPVPIRVGAAGAEGREVTDGSALWLKPRASVTTEEYREFYGTVADAFDEPALTVHYRAEGRQEYSVLVFVPSERPFDLFDPGRRGRLKLYVRRVFITDEAKILPAWLRFVRGVIDSADLPLNISRESMQDSALVRKIGDVVVKRLLKQLDKEACDDAKKYDGFYKDFSRFLKEGIATDFTNREAIAKLLRFESSMTQPGETVGLADYVKRMTADQKAIYYQVAHSRAAIESGPYVEAFKAKGIEVLYMFDTIDEYVVSSLHKFEEKDLKSVNADDIDLGDSDTEGEALAESETSTLCDWIKERLSASVETVRPGKRLVGSPALVLTPDGEMTPQMRQMMKALGKDGGMPGPKVVFEINPRHNLVKGLSKLHQSDPDTAGLITEQILDNALLSAGLLDEPQRIIDRTQKLMEKLAGN